MSHLRHVDSRSLRVSRMNGDEPRSLALESHPGQQALAGFIAEARAEVVALRTAGRRAQAISVLPANHAKEKLFPFHVLRVAPCQQGEVPEHEPRQFPAIREPQILPEVIWTSSSAGDQNRQERSVRIGDGAIAPQQLPQASLIVFHYWLATQTKHFQSFVGAGEVFLDISSEFRATDAEAIREGTAGFALAYARGKDTCKHVPVEGIARSGRVCSSQICV